MMSLYITSQILRMFSDDLVIARFVWRLHLNFVPKLSQTNKYQFYFNPNLNRLYYWIGTQKQSYKKGKLSEDKVALLNEIDFSFSVKPRDRIRRITRLGNKPFLVTEEWEKLFGELEEWKEQNGDCDVPQRSGR